MKSKIWLLLMFCTAVSVKAQRAPFSVFGPLKNINQSYGFGVGLNYAFAGNAPVFNNSSHKFESFASPQFSLNFLYAKRTAINFPEFGLGFSKYSTGYKALESDSQRFTLFSNYVSADVKYVLTKLGARTRGFISFLVSPGISLQQRNVTYYDSENKAVFAKSENYRNEMRKTNIVFGISGGQEVDFTHDYTGRFELMVNLANLLSKKPAGALNQLSFGAKVTFLMTN